MLKKNLDDVLPYSIRDCLAIPFVAIAMAFAYLSVLMMGKRLAYELTKLLLTNKKILAAGERFESLYKLVSEVVNL